MRYENRWNLRSVVRDCHFDEWATWRKGEFHDLNFCISVFSFFCVFVTSDWFFADS